MSAWLRASAFGAALASLAPGAAAQSILTDAWKLDEQSDRVALTFYQPNYLLPLRWSDRVNDQPSSPRLPAPSPVEPLDELEVKYQLSFKARVVAGDARRWGLWLAYTQQSNWQAYNSELSSPFRETNYMPEIILMHDPQRRWGGFDWRLASIGFTHQSNGRAEPLSRSWNRVMGQLGFENGRLAIVARPWLRVPEDAAKDDNADITDYLGHGDITFVWRGSENIFSFMARGNLRTGKGAVEASWTGKPLGGSPLRFYTQVFSGYGESLIDYNWRQTTLGVGIAFTEAPRTR